MSLAHQFLHRALRRKNDAFRAFNIEGLRSMSQMANEEDTVEEIKPSTPWVRSVISGVDLMRNSKVKRENE